MDNLSCRDEACDGTDHREALLAALLEQTFAAHHTYEQSLGDGDEVEVKWPQWYARYMLDNGLDALLDHPQLSASAQKISKYATLCEEEIAILKAGGAPEFGWADQPRSGEDEDSHNGYASEGF
jgi:hypothetical protein